MTTEDILWAQVAQKIRTRRIAMKISQTELGLRAGGIHRNAICRYENGSRTIKLSDFLNICTALEANPHYMLPDRPKPELSDSELLRKLETERNPTWWEVERETSRVSGAKKSV